MNGSFISSYHMEMLRRCHKYCIDKLLAPEAEAEEEKLSKRLDILNISDANLGSNAKNELYILRDIIDESCDRILDDVRKDLRSMRFDISVSLDQRKISIQTQELSNEVATTIYSSYKTLLDRLNTFYSGTVPIIMFLDAFTKLYRYFEGTDKRLDIRTWRIIEREDEVYSSLTLALDSNSDEYLTDYSMLSKLIEFCRLLPTNGFTVIDTFTRYADIKSADERKEKIREKFVSLVSEINRDFSRNKYATLVYDFIFEFLYDFLFRTKKCDVRKIDEIVHWLFVQRRIIEIIIYKLFVKSIGLPTIINLKIDEQEFDLVTFVNDAPKLALIEIDSGEIEPQEITNRTQNKRNAFQVGRGDIVKNVIWLVNNKSSDLSNLHNIIQIDEFAKNPLIILGYLYH